MNSEYEKIVKEMQKRWLKIKLVVDALSLTSEQVFRLGFGEALHYCDEELMKHYREQRRKK